MNPLWFLVIALALVAAFPRLLGRSAAGEPLFGSGDDRAVLRTIRVGTFGTALILSLIIISESR